MKNKATINLINLAANSEEFAYEKLIINNNEYKIGKEKSINIDFDDFETEMGSKIVKCEFIGVSNIRYRYFEAVEGDNNGFLFPEFGFIRDVVFPDDSKHEVKIMHKKKIIYEGHFFNRLLLINVNDNYDIWIDNIIVTESIIHITACGSAQVVPYDLENHFFCYKEISEIDYKEFFKFYDLKKDDAENFFKSIQRLVNIIPINLVDCQLFKDKINDEALNDLFLLKLNVSKSIASKYYNKEEYFNFICNCSLYYILSYLKDKISDPKIYLSIFKFFTDFKSEILKDSSLNYYNKSIVMMEFSYWMKNIENPAKFHNIKFKYYVRNKCKKNSILNSSLSFLEEFIDKLDENSPFLEPLIFIDSGYYIYNNDIVYGHGLISKELLKSHLKNVIPEVIFVYNDQKEIDDIALSNKANGAIELNLACNFFSKFKNISLDENVEDDKLRKNLSLKLVFVFLHEIFGHKKGGFSTRGKFINSPRIFYDKDKKAILRLTNKFSLEKGDNYINIIKGSNNSDSGYFLEYFLGQCDCGYISELLEIMMEKNIDLNFLFNNSLWNEKIKILREYIRLKYLVFFYQPELLNNTEFNTIDDEIIKLKDLLNKIKINIPEIIESQNKKINNININNSIEENPILKKLNSIIPNKYSSIQYYKNYENLTSDALYEKLKEKGISDELKKIIREILFSRIIKK